MEKEGRGGRLAKEALDSEARGRKKGRDDSQRGRRSSRANDLSGTRSQGPHGQQRIPSPSKSTMDTGPFVLPPGLGLGAGSTREEGMSQPSQAVRQLSAHRPAEPSLPHILARPRHCGVPGSGQGTQTERPSSSYSHCGMEGEGLGDMGRKKGHLKIRQRGHQLVQLPGGRGGRDPRLLLAGGDALGAAHLAMAHSDGGAAGRHRSEGAPSPTPCSPRAALPQGDQHVSSDSGIPPHPPPPACPTTGKPTSSRSLLGEEAAVGQGDRAEER